MKKILVIVLCVVLCFMMVACTGTKQKDTPQQQAGANQANAEAAGKDIRICVIPTVVHSWFSDVYSGAQQQAEFLSKQLNYNVKVEYYAPETGELNEQINLVEQVAATNPDGILICPLDQEALAPMIAELQGRGIAIGFINQYPGELYTNVVGVGNDFKDQGETAAKALIDKVGTSGKIAVMHGVTVSTHNERYNAILNYLSQYPDIKIIEAGYGEDNIEKSQQLAAAVIAANPDVVGFTCVDASAPVGIANAVKEADRSGEIVVVGMDDTQEILECVSNGTIFASSSTMPELQGSMGIAMIWEKINGMETAKFVDTGVYVVSSENVSEVMERKKANAN